MPCPLCNHSRSVTVFRISNGYLVQGMPKWENLEGGSKVRLLGKHGKYDPVYCKDMDQVLAVVERMLEDAGGKKGTD